MRGAGRLRAHLCLDLAGFLGKFVAVPEVGVIAKKAPRGRNTTSSCSPPAPLRPAPLTCTRWKISRECWAWSGWWPRVTPGLGGMGLCRGCTWPGESHVLQKCGAEG